MVGSVMKYFRMSFKEVTQERSYLNILLLNASIPQYREGKSESKQKDEPQHASEFFTNLMSK